MKKLQLILISIFFLTFMFSQYSIYETKDLSKVKWDPVDFGKMWTFDDIPTAKWEKLYGFKPTKEWVEAVQKSALQFGFGCSAAFVSEDGLIMTNHHCGRGDLVQVQKPGEDILRDGFVAGSLAEERKIPNLFVDQLVLIQDVTKDVIDAFSKGKDNSEKVKNKELKIQELESNLSKETGLICRVVTLYSGGKYSIYGYKRYTDVRLVMAPDFQIAATGWDWDNFTYPRYELDFAFYRAYDESGVPVKSPDHFSWSEKGAKDGELIFTVGRPGNTDRLLPIAQLEYFRDYTQPQFLTLYNGLYKIAEQMYQKYPEKESAMINWVMGVGNGRKSIAGGLMGLRDEFLMAKKRNFEAELKNKILSDPKLKTKYGHIWDKLKITLDELKKYPQDRAYNVVGGMFPEYFNIANKLIKTAEQLKLPEAEREGKYKNLNVEDELTAIYKTRYDYEVNDKILEVHSEYLEMLLKGNDKFVSSLYNNKTGKEAAEFALSKSFIKDKDKVASILKSDPSKLLNSGDVFVQFILDTRDKKAEISKKVKDLNNTLDVVSQELGEAIYEIYGNSISPDATSTLRISDGKIEGYEYNGTLAPGKVTYYGLYDRYFSFNEKTYPWGLHPRWKTVPAGLDLKTPIGFASNNDIVGGNSGSSIINTKMQVVGLVHDGNLESLQGAYLFLPINNRTVATDSWGLIEALKYVYKTDNLVKELTTGKLVK